MNDLLMAILNGLIGAFAGGFAGVVFERRRNAAITKSHELDNKKKETEIKKETAATEEFAADVWRSLFRKLREDVDQMRIELDNLKNENSDLKAENEMLKREVQVARNESAGLKKEIEVLRKRLAAFVKKYGDHGDS